MLPLCYGNDEDDVLYYAIADDHKEYCGDANWKIPEILLESTMFSNNNVQEVLESISIWDSVEKINELIGMHVNPINGSTSGVIVSSISLMGIIQMKMQGGLLLITTEMKCKATYVK